MQDIGTIDFPTRCQEEELWRKQEWQTVIQELQKRQTVLRQDAGKDEPAGDYVIPIGPAGDANPQTASARPAANKRCKLPIGASVDRWLAALDRPLFCLLPTFFLLCASKSLALAHCARWLLHLPPKHFVWAYQMAPPVGDQPDFWPPRLPDQKASLHKDFDFELELIVW
ncbi:predicted protein [Histoplasma capsulatum var. duboisii H88]|uniref:Predicted protein n=2 Tax=Ajellomyces capsulatus TaxID=5037 RepID=F0U4K8_AJEC8|nr:predicted protein [Histoplasma capsulatum H143]EGC41165.1 predicted protein [Histoplasma capsulatum var. duboisii H88]